MNTYCAVIKKNTENENLTVRKNTIFGKKKSTFIKNKDLHNFNDYFKVNKIVKIFLLTRDKFMPELHLKRARIYL